MAGATAARSRPVVNCLARLVDEADAQRRILREAGIGL
jgi:hypothetical protein